MAGSAEIIEIARKVENRDHPETMRRSRPKTRQSGRQENLESSREFDRQRRALVIGEEHASPTGARPILVGANSPAAAPSLAQLCFPFSRLYPFS